MHRIVSAFLAGTVGVPHELLSKVSPVMLATIFQNLPQGASTKVRVTDCVLLCAALCTCS